MGCQINFLCIDIFSILPKKKNTFVCRKLFFLPLIRSAFVFVFLFFC